MLASKTIAITGASSGLGRELAIQLSGKGTKLVLFARSLAGLQETERQCRDTGDAEILLVTGDVRNPDDCSRMIDSAVERFGQLDYLICNAGISMWSAIEDIADLSLFRTLMETNYLGAVHCVLPALPHLKKSKGGIVIVSSIQAKVGVPHHSAYAASKHALDGFCDSFRTEFSPEEVRLLVVYPHWIRGTNLRENAVDSAGRRIGDRKKTHNKDSISAEECATKTIRAMTTGKTELYIPAKLKILPWLRVLTPRLLRRIVSKKVKGQKA